VTYVGLKHQFPQQLRFFVLHAEHRQQRSVELPKPGACLQSGNLSAAQTAFASLQQSQNPGTQSTSSNNPVTADMTSLANALNSGNLSAAQASYTQLQKDSQAQGIGHHHHHHGGGGGGMGSAVQSLMSQLTSPSSTSTGTSSTSSAPGTLNVQA